MEGFAVAGLMITHSHFTLLGFWIGNLGFASGSVTHGVAALKLRQSGDTVIVSFSTELQGSQRSGLLRTVMLNTLQAVWFITAPLHMDIEGMNQYFHF